MCNTETQNILPKGAHSIYYPLSLFTLAATVLELDSRVHEQGSPPKCTRRAFFLLHVEVSFLRLPSALQSSLLIPNKTLLCF